MVKIMKNDCNEIIEFYSRYIYLDNPLFSNSHKELGYASKIDRLNKIIILLQKNNKEFSI